ncbi:MAG: TniQ family protein [Magnetospirillum sp.]|nr:TniQ family protein [Magnetospirillum sp.]
MRDVFVPSPRWPTGIIPYADESIIGFIFRLADFRRLSTANALRTAAGFEWLTNWPRREWLAALADEADLKIEALEPLAIAEPRSGVVLFRGFRLPAALFRRRGGADRRVCPECLAERAYHRAIWDLVCVAVCPIHETVLVDQCQCKAPLKWDGRGVTHCRRCSFDLRLLARQRVPAEQVQATKVIYGLLGEERFREEAERAKSMPPFADLAAEEIVDFMWRFGMEVVGTRPKIFSVEQPGEYAWEAHLALAAGLSAVESWPDGFHEVLEKMRGQWGKVKARTAVRRWLATLPMGHGGELTRALDSWD